MEIWFKRLYHLLYLEGHKMISSIGTYRYLIYDILVFGILYWNWNKIKITPRYFVIYHCFSNILHEIYAWRKNDLLHLNAMKIKSYARLNLILQKFNPFYVESPRHRYYPNTLSLFYIHCLHYIFCLISYISFLVLSFTQNHLQKKRRTNMVSAHQVIFILCMNFTPEKELHR